MTVCELSDKNTANIPLIQFLASVDVGITLHIHIAGHNTVYIDKVKSASHMLYILDKIAHDTGRHVRVTEVTVFESDSEVGLVVYCK